ncbi:MAG: hypothetical protein L0Y48_05535 [Fusobacteria bacterium]|nr:hypothetical protein [Fusobacteriota bacterium]
MKIKPLIIVNIFMLLLFLSSAVVGTVKDLFPDSIPYELFRAVHPKFGVAFFILAIVHITLNKPGSKLHFLIRKNK